MKTPKCFALVAQKKEGEPFKVIFRHPNRTPVVEQDLKNGKKFNMSFIHKMFMNTAVYEQAWIDKFNADREFNIAFNKEWNKAQS